MRSISRIASIAVIGVGLAACNTETLVDLQNPDLITGPVVRDSANAEQLYNGVLFEFGRAVSGAAQTNDNPGIVGVSGLMADEMWYSSTFETMQDIDERNITDVTNGVLTTVFQRIHRARNIADRTFAQLNAIDQGSSARAAKVANLSGFTFLFLAENFCSGVPVSSTALTGELVFGSPLTTAQLLDSAEARFATALSIATALNDANEMNLARVGNGRALLDEGDFAGAAAAVAAVPGNFVYNVDYSESATGQNNGIWQNINSERRSSVASGEGVNGLVFFNRGAAGTNTIDPRVSVDSIGRGIGTTTPLYAQHKYNTRGAGIPLGTGIEARLIEAEAALNKGASASYLTTLNTLRASGNVTGTLTDPGTAAGRVDQFFSERAKWLWLTGHRLSDLRRLVRQYGRTQDQVFPTGQTTFGAPYGSEVNLPIPFQERNNPNATSGACLDRNA
jgi:starch-binding outer membrane protein, SusD/RagB family